mgnify:CR=1 FL=1
MKIKYISKPVAFDSKPESYFVNGGSDDEFFIDEWFYDEDFVDEALKNFFEYNEKTKVVSFINKDGVTLKDLYQLKQKLITSPLMTTSKSCPRMTLVMLPCPASHGPESGTD